MASVRELMATDVVKARPDEMISDLVLRMARSSVGAVLVVSEGKLEGIFTERDLLTRVISQSRDPRTTPAKHVATAAPMTIDVGTPLREVLETFRQKRFRHLPVLENGAPVGILSTRDFLDALVEGFERYVDDVRYRRELADGVDPYDHMGGSYGR